jgi:tetratricopeptide (TPR) repeat protein
MRISLLIFTSLLFISCAEAQLDTVYETLIARAGLFHLQKDYKNAIVCFEKAFSLRQPDALNAYKAAGVYALDSNVDKGFYYINLALQLGWTEADQLAFDPYFDYYELYLRINGKKPKNMLFPRKRNMKRNWDYPPCVK